MKPAVFQDEAEIELEEAAAWYELHKTGLGREFLLSVKEAIQKICDNPRIGSRFGATRFRYVLVHRFPYVVFYSEGVDTIRVMAVAHNRRRPGYWKNRFFHPS
jgi:plasmid stabilization system protein ParE